MTVRSTRRNVLLGASGLALGAVATGFAARDAYAQGDRSMKAAQEEAGGPVRLAVLVGKPGATSSALHFVACEAKAGPLALGAPDATLPHKALATIFGTLVGGQAVAVVDEPVRGDPSYASVLVRIRSGTPLRLATGLAYASRPHASPETSEVLVSRGTPGRDARGARLDDLALDAIDVISGTARTLFTARGLALHLIGVDGDHVVFLVIGAPGGARFHAVHRRTGQVRFAGGSPSPVARDFVVDAVGHGIVFVDRHPTEKARWIVKRIDLARGAEEQLHEDTSGTLAPQIWPDGSLGLTRDVQKPLERFDIGRGRKDPAPALPRGVARLDALDAKSGLVAVSSTQSGALPVVSVVEHASGRTRLLTVPAGHRASVLGFLPSEP